MGKCRVVFTFELDYEKDDPIQKAEEIITGYRERGENIDSIANIIIEKECSKCLGKGEFEQSHDGMGRILTCSECNGKGITEENYN